MQLFYPTPTLHVALFYSLHPIPYTLFVITPLSTPPPDPLPPLGAPEDTPQLRRSA
jgi:hypothetical protein